MVDVAQGLSLDTKAYVDQLKSKLTADAQAKIMATTGVDTGNPQVQQGAVSAFALAQNGYNPDNPDDSAKLIHAISGGLCLIPGVGLVLGGAVEGLWLAGNAAAKPIGRLLYALHISGFNPDAPPRESSGGWTASSIMRANKLPAHPKGSFADFAVAALAEYAAQSANLKGDMPPAVVVDATILMWNKTHAGPAVAYFIPPLGASLGGIGISPAELIVGSMQNPRSGGSGPVSPATKAGKDPNVFYAFQPATLGNKDYLAQVSDVSNPKTWKYPFTTPFPVPSPPLNVIATAPRIAMVNTGALLPIPKKTIAFHIGNVGKSATPPPANIVPAIAHAQIPSLSKTSIASTPAPTKDINFFTIAGGGAVGFMMAGPIGGAIGAVVGWGAGKLLK